MPVQILTLKLDGITAGDYLTWCRDPDPPALDFALRSIFIYVDPLGDTITAILDWNQPLPAAPAAATAAGLPLSAGVKIHPLLTEQVERRPASHLGRPASDLRSCRTRERTTTAARPLLRIKAAVDPDDLIRSHHPPNPGSGLKYTSPRCCAQATRVASVGWPPRICSVGMLDRLPSIGAAIRLTTAT
jgi:hypothetical protein